MYTDAATVSELQKKRETLSREIERTRIEAEKKKQEAKKISTEIKKIDTDINSTEKRIIETESTISLTETDIGKITSEIASKENDLAREQSNQREAIRAIYETTEVNPVLLMGRGSISDAVDRASYLESLEMRIESTIDEITNLKNQLVARKAELEGKQKELEDLRRQQEAYKDGLDLQKDEKDRLLSETKSAQKELEKKVNEAVASAAAVEAQIQSLVRASTKAGSVIKSKDQGTSAVGFIWPMDYNYTTTEFGPTNSSYPFHQAYKFHYGLDIVNRACGTPVYASADGVANLFSTPTGYGNFIIVGHNARYSTLYGHLRSFGVSNGQEVKKGQVIGYEGTTGSSTGCHVHFEVWENGVQKNPRAFLP